MSSNLKKNQFNHQFQMDIPGDPGHPLFQVLQAFVGLTALVAGPLPEVLGDWEKIGMSWEQDGGQDGAPQV